MSPAAKTTGNPPADADAEAEAVRLPDGIGVPAGGPMVTQAVTRSASEPSHALIRPWCIWRIVSLPKEPYSP